MSTTTQNATITPEATMAAQQAQKPKREKPATVFTTNAAKLVWVRLDEPNPDNGKYEITLYISKSDTGTLDRFKTAFAAAMTQGKANQKSGGNFGNAPDFHKPLRSVNQDGIPLEYNGAEVFQINARSKSCPAMFDQTGQPTADHKRFSSGSIIAAELSLYPYTHAGKTGIGVGVNSIKFLRAGEPLFKRSSAEDFDVVDTSTVSAFGEATPEITPEAIAGFGSDTSLASGDVPWC